MWKLEWISDDCQWVIRSPVGISVARTYNRKVARVLLDQFINEGPWKETNSNAQEEKKDNKEDPCADDTSEKS